MNNFTIVEIIKQAFQSKTIENLFAGIIALYLVYAIIISGKVLKLSDPNLGLIKFIFKWATIFVSTALVVYLIAFCFKNYQKELDPESSRMYDEFNSQVIELINRKGNKYGDSANIVIELKACNSLRESNNPMTKSDVMQLIQETKKCIEETLVHYNEKY